MLVPRLKTSISEKSELRLNFQKKFLAALELSYLVNAIPFSVAELIVR
jgi:hypothetical protein